MKKIILCFLSFILLVSLCSCSTKYQNNDHHISIKFPNQFTVFVPSATAKDDARLAANDLTYEDVTSFGEQGGVFYATGETNGVKKEISVSVQESDYSQALWALKKNDEATINELQQELIDNFNAEEGITVKQKGQFQQGKAYCVYLNIINGDFDTFNSIYMTTIYNGKQYTILYYGVSPLSQKDIDECHKMFDSFYITQTLAPPSEEPKDTTTTKAVMVVLLVVIVAVAIIMVLRMFAHKKRQEEAEKDPYVPQFTNTLSHSSGKNTKEKKK